MIYIVGGNGFVGAAFVRLLKKLGVSFANITRENYRDFVGTECSVLINANGNSMKYVAERDALKDFDLSVRSVVKGLRDITAQKYVFLSSGDVYPDPSGPSSSSESSAICVDRISRYGAHKYLAEQVVRHAASDWLIFRMSGFCGPGLRKNAIFDMLAGDVVRLGRDSELQYISTDRAADLMWRVVTSGLSCEIVNIGASGTIALRDIHSYIGSASAFAEHAPTLRYELDTAKLARLTGETLPDTRSEVHAFLDNRGPS